ncbi:hypothetical protein T484DRAFT_2023408 [Baffinella frigidus]|nr:hypothetical protein T484DRAFT_2023408 [Cryptophyta sp. CCMP2293]
MKVVCKTVAGKMADIDVLETDTLAELKVKIEAAIPDIGGPVNKVIHAGKVFEEGKPLSEYNVTEGQTFVVMVSKAKPAPKPAASPVAASPAAAPAAAEASPAPATPVPAQSAPAADAAPSSAGAVPQPAAAPSTPSYEASASALLTGDGLEATVMQIMEMGFDRDMVMKAMRAAFNNPPTLAFNNPVSEPFNNPSLP